MENPPGFKRIEEIGKRIHYLSIPQEPCQPPRKFFKMTDVANFLKEQQKNGGYSGVSHEDFDFCKRSVKRKGDETEQEQQAKRSTVFDEPVAAATAEATTEAHDTNEKTAKFRFSVENLLQAGVKLDHKKLLQDAAVLLDDFRLRSDEPQFAPAKLADLKLRLANQETLQVDMKLILISPIILSGPCE